MAVLTVRDYFKHFEHICFDCPRGVPCRSSARSKYEPQLFNSQERTILANSIISLIHYNFTPLTTHPAFHHQIQYTKKIFRALKEHKGWSETQSEFVTNLKTFNGALENSCAMMIEWAKKECVPKVVEFFKSFAGPEYSPEHFRPPLLEFERLSELKHWSRSVRHQHFLNLAEILESYAISPRKPNLSQIHIIDLSAKNEELQLFFKEHAVNCPNFNYNVNAYPPNEFRRFCDGARRMGNNPPEKEKFNAVYGVVDCWTSYGRVRKSASTSNPKTASNKPSTLDKQIPNPFQTPPASPLQSKPMDLYSSPIALFFKKFNAPGYLDSPDTLPEDFKNLAEQECERINFSQTARTWAREIPDNAFGTRRGLSFQRSEFYKELQDQFYQALEQQFEWFLEFECQRQGLGKEEYLILFFELKESDLKALPDGKQRTAEQKKRALLQSLNINIYDFLDYHTELTRVEHGLTKGTNADPTGSNSRKLLKVKNARHNNKKKTNISPPSKVPEIPTNFPSSETLGLYCQLTGRVFSYTSAKEDETLARLLRHVGGYFAPECRKTYVTRLADEYTPGGHISKVDQTLLRLILRSPSSDVRNLCSKRHLSQPRDIYPHEEAFLQRKIQELFGAVRAFERESGWANHDGQSNLATAMAGLRMGKRAVTFVRATGEKDL